MATTAEEDLSQLERDIRTLKIEYEQFFGGGRKRPPSDTQWRVESLLKRYSDRGPEMNFSQRFRYTNLAQTFAKYAEIWRKKMKEREETDGPRHYGAAAKAIEQERAKTEARGTHLGTHSPPAAFSTCFSEPEHEAQRIEQLYKKLIEARKATGEEGHGPSFEDFGKFVRQKTAELKKKKGAALVEYSVTVEDGHVKLRARTTS